MHRVLMVSSLLSLIGVVQSSGMLRYLHHEMHLDIPTSQTAMFLQLVVAGHILLFSTRSRGFFFSPPFPERRFFCAIMGTQVLAAFMAAKGWLVHAISWELIGQIWAYNLCWLVVVDLVKVALYHHFDAQEAGQKSWQKWLHAPLDAFHGIHRR